jgi:DNA replication protein DnaC
MTNPTLEQCLRQLKLPAFTQHYARIAQEAATANVSYEGYLQALAEQELAAREIARQRRCLVQAQFPVVKELADFDWAAIPQLSRARVLALAQGSYISAQETVLLIGNPGLGKTHIATSLGVAACRQGIRVRFYTAAGLIADLMQAQSEHRLSRTLAQMRKYQVLIVDELGFLPLSQVGAQLLFQFCSTLHERVALIVTSNLRFADWPQLFGNESLTVALLDRLTARAHIVEFVGDSYRLRQRLQQPPSTQTHAFGGAAPKPPANRKKMAGQDLDDQVVNNSTILAEAQL